MGIRSFGRLEHTEKAKILQKLLVVIQGNFLSQILTKV